MESNTRHSPAVLIVRTLGVMVLVGAVATGIAIYRGWIEIPDRFNPWAQLNIAEERNFLTRYKLQRLSADPASCLNVLATTEFRFEKLTDRETGPACGFKNAVRIDATSARLNDSFSLTCPAAVSFALWERHVLQPNAVSSFGQRVATIEHFGSYSCRNVYGRANATRSEHATANAIDMAGFVLEDGRRIRVLKDWNGAGAEATFLRALRTGACLYFDGVLSPDYNDAHRDHFHLDRGRYRICR